MGEAPSAAVDTESMCGLQSAFSADLGLCGGGVDHCPLFTLNYRLKDTFVMVAPRTRISDVLWWGVRFAGSLLSYQRLYLVCLVRVSASPTYLLTPLTSAIDWGIRF